MNTLIARNSGFLKLLYQSSRPERKTLIENSTTEEIRSISAIASKIIQGQIILSQAHNSALHQYRRVLRALVSPRISTRRKRRTLLAFIQIVPILAQQVLVVMDES